MKTKQINTLLNLLSKTLLGVTFSLTADAFVVLESEKNYFHRCNNPELGNSTQPFYGNLEKNTFRPECAPDVLYMWLGTDFVESEDYKTNFISAIGTAFTWRTPLGTFAYGERQTRIKLKPNVKFKLIHRSMRDCSKLSEEEKRTTVFTSYLEKGLNIFDYIICSMDVVHSWSTGTPEAHLEAQRELDYISRHYHKNVFRYDSYAWLGNRWRGNGDFNLEEDGYFKKLDIHWAADWGLGQMMTNLQGMENLEGQIYYAPEVEPNSKEHFHSSKDTYWKL